MQMEGRIAGSISQFGVVGRGCLLVAVAALLLVGWLVYPFVVWQGPKKRWRNGPGSWIR